MRKIAKFWLLLVIALMMINIVSAACSPEFVTYYGACDTPGDISVINSQGEVVVEQFYTIDKGCYDHKFAVSVPGGKDCLVVEGEGIKFLVSGAIYGEAEWTGHDKIVNLDLQRPGFEEEVVSSGLLYLVLTILILVIIFLMVVELYRRIRRRYGSG
jgi:hypothetical protein